MRLLEEINLFSHTLWPFLFLSLGRSMGEAQQPTPDLLERISRLFFLITDSNESSRLCVQHWSPLALRFLALAEIAVRPRCC